MGILGRWILSVSAVALVGSVLSNAAIVINTKASYGSVKHPNSLQSSNACGEFSCSKKEVCYEGSCKRISSNKTTHIETIKTGDEETQRLEILPGNNTKTNFMVDVKFHCGLKYCSNIVAAVAKYAKRYYFADFDRFL